jgi:hypothetical protein
MGLDMYLAARVFIPRDNFEFEDKYGDGSMYVSNWSHNNLKEGDPELTLFNKLVKLTGITPTEDSPSFEVYSDDDEDNLRVEPNIGYWRKANQIHAWFVEYVQDGIDECEPNDVRPEQLENLRAACKVVLEDPTKASLTLPTQSGFFFGGTEYNEWYLKDLERTVEIVDKALELKVVDDVVGFIYRSSW